MLKSIPDERKLRIALVVFVVGTLAAGLLPTSLQAIPAFARKYQTSCQTCHIAFPKLNNYGEAFRLLGYHLPGETEGQVKTPDVSLGAEAYKKVWPDSVWPGAIPSHVPLALTAEFLAQNTSTQDGEGNVNWDFVAPSEVTLLAGGSAGDNVSFFGEISFEREVEDGVVNNDVGVEHFDVRFIRPIHHSTAFNVKIGAFKPELVSTFEEARRLTVTNYDSMFSVGVANPGGAEAVGEEAGLALPTVTTGVEMYGVASHRVIWAAGLVNGLGPGQHAFDGNSSKDVYGRLAYKWGGLAPDGSNAATYAGSPKNWREKSFRLGLFDYHGNGSGIFIPAGGEEEDTAPTSFVEDRSFDRWGVDVNAFYKDLNVFGAYVEGRDNLKTFAAGVDDPGVPGLLLADDSGDFTYRAWFLEADAVLGYPWLDGALRFENVDLPKSEDGVPVQNWQRATASITGLIRANVKGTAEYTWDLNESANNTTWLRLMIAF